MKDLTIFKFENNDVREITDKDGNPWFVAKDVCAALELKNRWDAVSRLDDSEKDYLGINDAMNRERETTIINESGVYELAFTSRSKKAKEFKKWLKNDVLPSIRKTGGYHADIELNGRMGIMALLDRAETLGVRGSDVVALVKEFNAKTKHENGSTDTCKKSSPVPKQKPAKIKKSFELTEDGWYQASEIAAITGLPVFKYGGRVNKILVRLGVHRKEFHGENPGPNDFKWVMCKGFEDCVKEKINEKRGYTHRWFNSRVAKLALPVIKKEFNV